MESPRKTLIVSKGNKYENDQEAGRSPNTKTPKRGHGLFFKGEFESDQEMGVRNVTVENPKRSPAAATKHFMFPTISAASKASPARKKVLGERNEAGETHLVKTPCPRSRSVSCDRFGVKENADSMVDGILLKGRASVDYSSPRPRFLRYNPERRKEVILIRENEGKEQKKYDAFGPLESGYASDDICYDPIKNYLSPRPKFLWYDPNRSRERTLRRETVAREPSYSDNVTDLGYSSSSLSSEESGKEREEVEESDGEVKEADKSGGVDKEDSENDREVTELDESNKEVGERKEVQESDGERKEVDESGREGKEVSENDTEVTELDDSNKEVGDSEKESNKAEEGNMDGTNCLEAHNDDAGDVDFIDSGRVMFEESDGGGEVSEDADESDLELEEAEVQKGWCLTGVLKFLLLLFVLAISSSVILNLDSSYPPTSLQLERTVEREGGQITFAENDQMPLISLNLEVPGMSFAESADEKYMDDEDMHGEENMALDAEDQNLSMGLIDGESGEVRLSVEQEERGKESDGMLELWNVQSPDLGGLVVPVTCCVTAFELSESEGVESPQKDTIDADEDIQLDASGLESETDIYEAVAEDAIEKTPELLAVELQEIELPSLTHGLESANVLMEPIKEQIIDSNVVESIENPSGVNENPEIFSRVANMEVLEVPFTTDVIPSPEMQLEGAADNMESANADLDEHHIEDDTVGIESGRTRIIGGIFALSLAVGSLFWVVTVKRKRMTQTETLQVEEPSVENKQNLEHVVPNLAKTPFDLIEKYSRAPSVELLSEFAVRDMSSLRTCGMKSWKVETDEVSSHSMSFGKAMTRKAYSVPVQVQPAISAISSTENRSVTNWEESSEVESSKKKKLTTPVSRRRTSRVRSEDEGSEVLSMNTTETPTTLRRSSRLRSRGIVSP